MSLCIVDLLEVIYIQYDNGKASLIVFGYALIELFLCFEVGVLVSDSGQRVHICFCGLLGKTLFISLFLLDIGIDIGDADYEPVPLFLIYDRRLELDIGGFIIQVHTVDQGENALFLDLGKHAFFLEEREESGEILRIDQLFCLLL